MPSLTSHSSQTRHTLFRLLFRGLCCMYQVFVGKAQCGRNRESQLFLRLWRAKGIGRLAISFSHSSPHLTAEIFCRETFSFSSTSSVRLQSWSAALCDFA